MVQETKAEARELRSSFAKATEDLRSHSFASTFRDVKALTSIALCDGGSKSILIDTKR